MLNFLKNFKLLVSKNYFNLLFNVSMKRQRSFDNQHNQHIEHNEPAIKKQKIEYMKNNQHNQHSFNGQYLLNPQIKIEYKQVNTCFSNNGIECKFYNGKPDSCPHYAKCQFVHFDNKYWSTYCYYYNRGYCKKGNKCKFIHEYEDGYGNDKNNKKQYHYVEFNYEQKMKNSLKCNFVAAKRTDDEYLMMSICDAEKKNVNMERNINIECNIKMENSLLNDNILFSKEKIVNPLSNVKLEDKMITKIEEKTNKTIESVKVEDSNTNNKLDGMKFFIVNK